MRQRVEPADGIRLDIQALRALAVAVVVIYHASPASLTGGYIGVDVFFVVSGFLITSHLVRSDPRKPIEVAAFWARRVRRLLPAATAALVGTVVLTLLFLPSTSFAITARHVAASALAVENWNLIASATDYLASDDAPTPVQHFWSLGIEEQFYVFWPLLLALTGLVAVAWRRKAVAAVIATVVVASFAASVVITSATPSVGYFTTVTRVWELGVGALIAVVAGRIVGRGPVALRHVLWWGGLGAIAVSAVTFSTTTAFPGYAAALPVLGTAACIVAAADGLTGSGRRVFGSAPAQWLGDRSYAIYLWHWPLLVAMGAAITQRWLGVTIAIAATLALSAATKRWLEDLPRRSPRLIASGKLTAALLIGCTLLSLGGAGSLVLVSRAQAADGVVTAADIVANPCLGAGAVRDPGCGEVPLSTNPVAASQDKPDVYDDGCWSRRPFTDRAVCSYGDADSDVRVALFGNSHAGHWQPPVAAVADAGGLALDTYLASECYSVDVPIDFDSSPATAGCLDYVAWATDAIAMGDYDLVVLSNRTFLPLKGVDAEDQTGVQQDAYARLIEDLRAAGSRVLVMRDTPAASVDVPACLAAGNADCSTPRAEALEVDPLALAATASADPGVHVFEVTDIMCGPQECPPIVGGLITYFDHGHMTRSLALTLTPEVREAMAAALASG